MHFVHSTIIMHERPTVRHRHRAGKGIPPGASIADFERRDLRAEAPATSKANSGLAELLNWAGQGGWPAAPLHISGDVSNRCPAAKGLVDTRDADNW